MWGKLVKKVDKKYLLRETRRFNKSIHKTGWRLALEHHAHRVAWRLYVKQPHWHGLKEGCVVKDLPFEIVMEAVALISSVWVSDIFLRKARDRRAPGMAELFEEWIEVLVDVLRYTHDEVNSKRDLGAEKAWQKDLEGTDKAGTLAKMKCFLNRLIWGH